jgi:hypothetical protein
MKKSIMSCVLVTGMSDHRSGFLLLILFFVKKIITSCLVRDKFS